MKKFFAVFLALLLALSLFGCGAKEKDPVDELEIPSDVAAGDFLPHSNAVTLTSKLEAIGATTALAPQSMADYFASFDFGDVEIAGVAFQYAYLSYTPSFGGVDELSYTAEFNHDAQEEFLAVAGYLAALYELEDLRAPRADIYQGKHTAANGEVYTVDIAKWLGSETECAINVHITADARPVYAAAFKWIDEPIKISELTLDYSEADSLVSTGMSYEEVCEVFLGSEGNVFYQDGTYRLVAFVGPYDASGAYNSVLLCAFNNDSLEFSSALAYNTETMIYSTPGEAPQTPDSEDEEQQEEEPADPEE